MRKRQSLRDIVHELITKVQGFSRDGQIYAEVIPTRTYARLGRVNNDFLLLLPSSAGVKEPRISLARMSVDFGLECKVQENGIIRTETLTIVRFLSPDSDLEYMIGEIVALLLNRAPRFKNDEVKLLIIQLVELFKSLNQPSESTILGLWGELFTICQSSNPEDAAKSWHATPQDRFDFSLNNWRVEVKTTRGPRQHTFSYEQLIEGPPVRILIASIIASESENGVDVLELTDKVLSLITNQDIQGHILNVVMKTLGPNIQEDILTKYDYVSAQLAMRFFDSKNVPQPAPPPPGVFQLRFKSDLQLVQDLDRKVLSRMNGLPSFIA
jgi:hypothetical protein